MLQLSRWKVALVVLATVLGILFSLPNVLPAETLARLPGWVPAKRLNLGLDLQGGSYLKLEVDTAALSVEKRRDLIEEIRGALRNAKVAFREPTIVGSVIRVQIDDVAQFDTAQRTLNNTSVPLSNGVGRSFSVVRVDERTLEIRRSPEAEQEEALRAVEMSREIIGRRIDELGTREPSITRQGVNRIVIQAPGESDPERLKAIIGQTAKLTFQMLDETMSAQEAQQTGRIPPGSEILQSDEEGIMLVRRRVLVSGEQLINADQIFDSQTGRPIISFRFDGAGGKAFGEATTRNVGKRFAIILDGKVISAPVIQGPINGGSGVIQGNFTIESARDLAMLLRAGALPAPLTVEEQRTVSAELGAEAVQAGKTATVVAFIGVLVFMVLAYGFLFGGISVVGLLVNGALIVAAMSITQATLTLPGIAGLILTLAMAVDANVLIYERMRDEVRAGRTPIMAMEAGFSRAMVTIFDANLTTLIAAWIMFFFGEGPVKGFAWTLSIGVLTSVFTSVLITQVLLAVWFRTARPKALPIV